MKIQYTKEDFKRGVKNPFFDEFCKIFEIAVDNEDYALFKKIAESYDITPEQMMQSCLHSQAELLREDYPDE